MKKKKPGRPKGIKLSQTHKDNISKAIKKKHRKWKRAGVYEQRAAKREATKLNVNLALRRKDEKLDTFSLTEVKRNLVVFTIIPIKEPTEIELDFRTESIAINVPEAFRLSSDNGMSRKFLEDLLSQLSAKYPSRIEERFSSRKGNVWGKKKAKAKALTNQKREIKKVVKQGHGVKDRILNSIKEGHWKNER